MPNADYLTHEDVCEICGNLVCEHREESNDSEDDDDDDDEDIELEDDGDGDKVPNLVGGNHHGNDNSDSEEALGSPDEDEALHIAKKPEKNHTKNDDTIDGDDHEEEEEEEGEEEEEEEEEWEDEDEDNEDDEDDEEIINDTCDIILDYPVKKGEEITRHYGPYSNKVLLSKYGFAVEDNAHDTVTIQLEMVRQAAEQFIKDKTLVEERIEWFLENEDAFIGDEHEDNDHEYGHEGGCCDSDDNHMHDHGVEQGREEVEEVDAKHKHFKNSKKKSQIKEQKIDDEDQEETEDEGQDMSENGEEDEENEEDEDEEGFPKDLMYMMHDGSVDDRLLMLLNVLFMEKNQFKKVKEDMDIATEYFSDIFRRRQQEEHGDDDDEDESEDEDMEVEDEEGDEEDNAKVTMKALQKPELKPRDVKSKKVRRAVLKAILALIRIRADTFGVTDKTTAEQDLESLKKAKLSGPLYYGGLCVQGEKQILQNALQGYTHFLSEL
ncbi:hypothetical protein BX616_001976 [Lobosporangium transversale]|nr:hypothetical protein BX616_001976 [Lobosporangium transversale]